MKPGLSSVSSKSSGRASVLPPDLEAEVSFLIPLMLLGGWYSTLIPIRRGACLVQQGAGLPKVSLGDICFTKTASVSEYDLTTQDQTSESEVSMCWWKQRNQGSLLCHQVLDRISCGLVSSKDNVRTSIVPTASTALRAEGKRAHGLFLPDCRAVSGGRLRQGHELADVQSQEQRWQVGVSPLGDWPWQQHWQTVLQMEEP